MCNPWFELVDLPGDILIDILSRLPVKSVCCIECVSKTLLNIVRCPFFVEAHTNLLSTTNAVAEVRQLMLVAESCTQSIQEITVLQSLEYDGKALNKSKYTIASKIVLSRYKYYFQVEFVFCNVLCFKDTKFGSPCFLLNPFRGEVLMLPTSSVQGPTDLKSKFLFDWYGMGFDSTTNTHKIVRVAGNADHNYLVAQVIVLGTSSWREIQSVPPCNLSKKKVSAYGDMHWLVCLSSTGESQHISILSFDFNKEEFLCIPHPTMQNMPRKDFPLNRFHLVNLTGSLSIVDASSDKYVEIWMLKNYDEKEWMLGHRIEVRMRDLYPYRAFRLWTCGEWEHGLFFKVFGSSNSTVFFLDLRSVSMNQVACPISERGLLTSILSYTGSLISLKNYGNLVQAQARNRNSDDSTKIWVFD